MAYDKYTWQTGEVITQEKLNHMEDGIENAYELPAVTETDNGKVLGVENGAWSLVNGGGGCDCGFECTETVTELFNETVTTIEGEDGSSATLAYSQEITADTLIVTFDGVEYTCERQEAMNQTIYGAVDPSDYSEFPFAIISFRGGNMLATETAGEYTVKAAISSLSVDNITPCFEKAVQNANSALAVNVINLGENHLRLDNTWQAIHDAYLTRGVVVRTNESTGERLMPLLYIGVDSTTSSHVVALASDSDSQATVFRTASPNGNPEYYRQA